MDNLKELILCLISSSESFADTVAKGNRNAINNELQSYVSVLGEVLPELVAAYDSREVLRPLKEDQGYWPAQLERIMGAVEKGDLFLLYDAVENELTANLKLLLTVIA